MSKSNRFEGEAGRHFNSDSTPPVDARAIATFQVDDSYGVQNLSTAVFDALSLLKPYDVDVPKVRVGAARDGGYVMAQLESGSDLLSFGIANDVRFEKEMAMKKHRCFMYDHTIDILPDRHDNFNFFRRGICGVGQQTHELLTLEDNMRTLNLSERLLLKIDVEGAEWGVFSTVPDEILCRFDQIVGEFHWLFELENELFRTTFCEAMTRLNRYFTLFHVHANNCRRVDFVKGFPVADVLELSFVNTSLIRRRPSQTVYPTTLDLANNHAVCDHALLFYPFLPMAVNASVVNETIARIQSDRGKL
jgi:hypothetical protein